MTDEERAFLAAARRAVLATVGGNGRPRLVPVCFVVGDDVDVLGGVVVYSPLDEKPKSVADLRELSRVRDLLVHPEVALLVDRWEEDWTRLGWLRCHGRAGLMEPELREVADHARAVAALRDKYPQYVAHALDERPIVRIRVDRVVRWGDLSVGDPPPSGIR